MMPVLNSLSHNYNICIVLVLVCVECLFSLIVIFLLLGVVSDFCLYPEPGYCVARLCLLFKSFFLASFHWHCMGQGEAELCPTGWWWKPWFPIHLPLTLGEGEMPPHYHWMSVKVQGPLVVSTGPRETEVSRSLLSLLWCQPSGQEKEGHLITAGEVDMEAPCSACADGVAAWQFLLGVWLGVE